MKYCFLSSLGFSLLTFGAVAFAAEASTTRGVIKPGKPEQPADAVQLVGPDVHTLVPEGAGPSKWELPGALP